jgi:hypothetical protein
MTLWQLNHLIGTELSILYNIDKQDLDLWTKQFEKYRTLKKIFLKYRIRKMTKSEQQLILINDIDLKQITNK